MCRENAREELFSKNNGSYFDRNMAAHFRTLPHNPTGEKMHQVCELG